MIGVNELVDLFCNWNISSLSAYSSLISTKDEKGIFPPYVPFVGKKYDKYRIFVYGMAQNVKQNDGYLIQYTDVEKVKRLYKSIDIAPRQIMYALVGVYLYAKYRVAIENFTEIKEYIGITNYYKFSLNDGKRDINPNRKLNNLNSYWELNDALSSKELEFLKPKVIISFKGRHNTVIRKNGFSNLVTVNDPSWILQGARGCLKENGSWYRKQTDTNVIDLLTKYISQIDKNGYQRKKEAVRIYLGKYFYDWCN
jgi:hypothetical protein